MTPDERRGASFLVAFGLVVVFVVLAIHQWGDVIDGPAARGAEDVIQGEGRTSTSPLRCAQATTFDAKNRPQYTRKTWTQERAEAEIEYAWQSLNTARHYGGNAALKQAWATEALAALELVRACWGTP